MVKNCSKARLYINNRQPSIIHLILLSNNSILYFCVIINDYSNLNEKIRCIHRPMRVMGLANSAAIRTEAETSNHRRIVLQNLHRLSGFNPAAKCSGRNA